MNNMKQRLPAILAMMAQHSIQMPRLPRATKVKLRNEAIMQAAEMKRQRKNAKRLDWARSAGVEILHR